MFYVNIYKELKALGGRLTLGKYITCGGRYSNHVQAYQKANQVGTGISLDPTFKDSDFTTGKEKLTVKVQTHPGKDYSSGNT